MLPAAAATATAVLVLPAVVALLPRCLCCSNDNATMLPPLTLRCRRHCHAAHHRCAATTLLPSALRCRHRHRHRASAASIAVLPPHHRHSRLVAAAVPTTLPSCHQAAKLITLAALSLQPRLPHCHRRAATAAAHNMGKA